MSLEELLRQEQAKIQRLDPYAVHLTENHRAILGEVLNNTYQSEKASPPDMDYDPGGELAKRWKQRLEDLCSLYNLITGWEIRK